MKSNTNDPPEEVNLVAKKKGRDFKKNLSGKPKQGKNVPPKKKTTGNARIKFYGKQQLQEKGLSSVQRKVCLLSKMASFCIRLYGKKER